MARGVDFLIFVNTGTEGSPVWTKVAGQRGATLNREAETLDMTSKDNSGWADADYGNLSWGIDGDGLLVENDAGYLALENAFMSKQPVKVRLQTAASNKYEGSAIITSFPIEAPYDDNAAYNVTLTGKGALTKTP
ncbi:phage major tail protein, TP901-1 family [Brevibacillus choshinensis]|uniref:phage tail tube protein n=1 Tax=Brevibacillus choshinensis TaxID=54911 RepID=UPI002E1DDA02|nr:phage major tail protein, TP901-1 family [Brevibacillus choshinensis]MED4586672.1 phage major tail protein, TP901-1 family [Brevibacillus choshinensis]